MIEEIITPLEKTYNIEIPNKYIGKNVKLILYSLDEVSHKRFKKEKKPSDYFGTLSKDDAKEMKEYIHQSRNEWNRNI